MQDFFQPRITDYSYRACRHIDSLMITQMPSLTSDLQRLYAYQKTQWTVHPMTNWQSHRLMLQACIAVKLLDRNLCQEIHRAMLKWIKDSDCRCCDGHSQDFHWRDSLEYLVYGLQAYVRAGLYLKPVTRYDYKRDIAHIMRWLDPFLEEQKIHIEYVNSRIASDTSKKSFKKPFDPAYARTLLKWYSQL
jgi:hypothetical protein